MLEPKKKLLLPRIDLAAQGEAYQCSIVKCEDGYPGTPNLEQYLKTKSKHPVEQ